jgi:hypothetical protein
MTARDFDPDAPQVQEALFPRPDALGTPMLGDD